jgi:fructose 1,6-bisphosphate aldolase/phosphatase
MKITVSVIKADIGSIGGHTAPSPALMEGVGTYVRNEGRTLLLDVAVSHTGDDIAILMTHSRGVADEQIHKLAWQAFVAGTEVAKRQGLYGAGQDLLKDAFSGNVPFWQSVRLRVAEKAVEMRRQGFFGPAMLPVGELEYTGIVEKLSALEKRFVVRPE